MRIHYEYDITDQDADDIVKLLFTYGNQRIGLPWYPWKYTLELPARLSVTVLLFILTFTL